MHEAPACVLTHSVSCRERQRERDRRAQATKEPWRCLAQIECSELPTDAPTIKKRFEQIQPRQRPGERNIFLLCPSLYESTCGRTLTNNLYYDKATFFTPIAPSFLRGEKVSGRVIAEPGMWFQTEFVPSTYDLSKLSSFVYPAEYRPDPALPVLRVTLSACPPQCQITTGAHLVFFEKHADYLDAQVQAGDMKGRH